MGIVIANSTQIPDNLMFCKKNILIRKKPVHSKILKTAGNAKKSKRWKEEEAQKSGQSSFWTLEIKHRD
jgi:hypothetical protein